MNKDYSEILCRSIEIIGKSLLEGLKYDQTILCTIVDDSDAKNGKYRVSNGSSSFIAYSSEKYSNNTSVYVTVPSGDYNNDKLIVGKAMKEELSQLYNYVAPFEHYLDITGNCFKLDIEETACSLLANEQYNDDEDPVRLDPVGANMTSILLGKTEFAQPKEGFTHLGLKASFRSLLSEYNCLSGDYGLEVKVTFEVPDASGNETGGVKTNVQYLYLNSKDMIGNPYNFETYFQQEKLFQIENMGAVTSIEVRFKQAGNFYDFNKNPIPYLEDNEGLLDSVKLWDNLFVKDVYISLGYDINSQDGEFIQLYTLNRMSYSPKTLDDNKKTILLRWLHESENSKYQIDEESNEDFDIRWYRYRTGAPAADGYCGVNWEAFNIPVEGDTDYDQYTNGIEIDSVLRHKGCGRRFQAVLEPDTTIASEQIKVVILYGPTPGYYEYNPNPFVDIDTFKSNYYKGYYVQDKIDENGNTSIVLATDNPKTGNGTYRMVLNQDKDAWTMENAEISWDKVQYYYKVDNREVYRSSIITFTNEEDPISKATMGALTALSLQCYDLVDSKEPYKQQSYGNYLLYDERNSTTDTQANLQRLITWTLDVEDFDFKNVSKVEWIYPDMEANNSMLHNIVTWKHDTALDGTVITDGNKDNEDFSLGLTYNIRKQYSISYGNNTITCKVTYNGTEFTAEKIFAFGQYGTMGATATFILRHADNKSALTVGQIIPEEGDPYYDSCLIRAELYDENQRLVDDLSNYTIDWSWYTSPTMRNEENAADHIEYNVDNDNEALITLHALNTLNMDECYILKAILKGWNNATSDTSYDLVAYMPIALRYNENYRYISGESIITYLTDGSVKYDKSHYILHTLDEQTLTEGWGAEVSETSAARNLRVFSSYRDNKPIEEETMYFPHLKMDKTTTTDTTKITWRLSPSPIFFEGMQTQFAVQYYDNNILVWTQPLLIILSRYFSSVINNWDGETLTLDEGSSTVLASRIGAGRKNSENQFSGVVLGDWQEKSDINVETLNDYTGLFGFRNGLMSFGFKDDGTAFIGTKTAGRLQFDGNQSTISSAGYLESTAGGIYLDFNAAKMKLRQGVEDMIAVVTKTTNGYEAINDGKPITEATWRSYKNVTLYIENIDEEGNKTYSRVTKWDSNWGTEKVFYKYVTKYIDYPPFAGIENADALTKKMDAWGVKSLKVFNNSTKNYDTITGWSDKYTKQTVFYHPDMNTNIRSTDRYIELNATAADKPLKIGSKFSVGWDGTLQATDGSFSGNIDGSVISGSSVSTYFLSAYNGEIGGWAIDTYTISNQNVILDALGTIKLCGVLNIYSSNSDWTTKAGYIGYSEFNGTGDEDTSKNGIGMYYTGGGTVKATAQNAGAVCGDAYLSCSDGTVLTGLSNGANIRINNNGINLNNGAIRLNNIIVLTTDSYGPNEPSGSGVTGQLYFQTVE